MCPTTQHIMKASAAPQGAYQRSHHVHAGVDANGTRLRSALTLSMKAKTPPSSLMAPAIGKRGSLHLNAALRGSSVGGGGNGSRGGGRGSGGSMSMADVADVAGVAGVVSVSLTKIPPPHHRDGSSRCLGASESASKDRFCGSTAGTGGGGGGAAEDGVDGVDANPHRDGSNIQILVRSVSQATVSQATLLQRPIAERRRRKHVSRMDHKRIQSLPPRRRWMHWLAGYRFADLDDVHIDILLQYAIDTRNVSLFCGLAQTCAYAKRCASEHLRNARRPHLGDLGEWPVALHHTLHDKTSWAFARCWSCALERPATDRNANVLDLGDNRSKTVLLCGHCNRKFGLFYYCVTMPTWESSVFVCGRNPSSAAETRVVIDGLSDARVHLRHHQTWVNARSGTTKTLLSVVVEFRVLACIRRYRLCMAKKRAREIFGTDKLRVGTRATQPKLLLCLEQLFENSGSYGVYLWMDVCAFARRIQQHRHAHALSPPTPTTGRKAIRTPQKVPECDHPFEYHAPTSPTTWYLRACSACGHTDCNAPMGVRR